MHTHTDTYIETHLKAHRSPGVSLLHSCSGRSQSPVSVALPVLSSPLNEWERDQSSGFPPEYTMTKEDQQPQWTLVFARAETMRNADRGLLYHSAVLLPLSPLFLSTRLFLSASLLVAAPLYSLLQIPFIARKQNKKREKVEEWKTRTKEGGDWSYLWTKWSLQR